MSELTVAILQLQFVQWFSYRVIKLCSNYIAVSDCTVAILHCQCKQLPYYSVSLYSDYIRVSLYSDYIKMSV